MMRVSEREKPDFRLLAAQSQHSLPLLNGVVEPSPHRIAQSSCSQSKMPEKVQPNGKAT